MIKIKSNVCKKKSVRVIDFVIKVSVNLKEKKWKINY